MMRFRFAGPLAGPVIVIGALLTLAACGGGEPTDTPARPTPTATTATAVPAPTATPAPTPTPAPTQTPTPEPTATPTPEPTPTPELLTTYNEFGFALRLERGADVRTPGSPSAQQGALSFAYGEVNTVLT